MSKIISLSLMAACLVLVSACQTAPETDTERRAPARGEAITGSVSLPSGASLSSNAELRVRLIEASRGVGEATVIAEDRQRDPGSPPLSYRLRFSRGDINEDEVYLVEAFVYDNGLLRFTNTFPFQVLTMGHGSTADIRVVRVDP